MQNIRMTSMERGSKGINTVSIYIAPVDWIFQSFCGNCCLAGQTWQLRRPLLLCHAIRCRAPILRCPSGPSEKEQLSLSLSHLELTDIN